MLDVTTAGWAATLGLIAVLLAIDLFVSRPPPARRRLPGGGRLVGLLHRGRDRVRGRASAMIAGWDFGAQYFAGYIVEKSLSVDNLFVFVIIMTTFAVPAEHQQRVLTIGILLALVLRAIFIALGAALLSAFSFMFLIFGLLLRRHGDPAVPPPRPGPVGGGQRAGRARAPAAAVHRPLRRGPARHPGRRPARAHAAVPRAAGHRQHRHPLRARLDPGGVRRQPTRRSSSSPPTPSPCSACARCSSSSPACWTGSSTSRPGCRSSSRSSASS